MSKVKMLSKAAYDRIGKTTQPLYDAMTTWLNTTWLNVDYTEKGRMEAKILPDEAALIQAFDKWRATLLKEIAKAQVKKSK